MLRFSPFEVPYQRKRKIQNKDKKEKIKDVNSKPQSIDNKFNSKQNGLRQPNMVLDNIPIKKTEINILWIPPENDKRGLQKERRLVELRVYKRKSPQNVRHNRYQ